ncbi:RNA-dependent RNA polymerase [Beihai narna-like virus 8]|uniref:RNA-dependent RNA polymerase n=1 Tax=Beihai narna-like virus 8 TaxID=1922460 RepID=UPI00090A5D09|nr:RNA-dependent RNA polymerase [Beihai narna-like virus 8]APG77089.1 RNA-dependent RNA polymerase [Beihai narna-like virus 8]
MPERVSRTDLGPILTRFGIDFQSKSSHLLLLFSREERDYAFSAFAFLRSLTECLSDADRVLECPDVLDFVPTYRWLMDVHSGEEQVKRMKFLTAWPMARWLRNPLPPPPPRVDSDHFRLPFAGRTHRHLRNLLASRTTSVRSCTVFVALLQGVKRGCAEVNEEFISAALAKHQQALRTPIPALDPDTRRNVRAKFSALWRRETPSRQYGEWKKVYNREGKCRIARREHNCSIKASFGYSRGAGGRVGALARLAKDYWQCGHNELLSMDYDPSSGRVVTQYGIPSLGYAALGKLALMEVSDPQGQCHATDALLYRTPELLRGDGLCSADVKPILEPLKCRLITAGSPVSYAYSMSAQKSMWRHLHDNFPQFKLIGSPLVEDDLGWVRGQTSSLDLPFDQWVSGDYSAATDGLGSEINRLCIDAYCDAVQATPTERKIWRAVSGNHSIHYTGEKVADAVTASVGSSDPFLMENGQLMGSVLSFPLLCAINLVAYWAALEEFTGRRFQPNDLPVLVNGDDICFLANDAFYKVWQDWISRVGFTLSLGKNYISPDFVTINSESFMYSQRRCTFRRIGFLNTGLLIPSASIRPENRRMPLTGKLQRLLSECNNPERTWRRFIHYNKAALRDLTLNGNVNVFGANALGSLGVTPPPGLEPTYTAYQKKMAKFLYDRHLATWADNEEAKVGSVWKNVPPKEHKLPGSYLLEGCDDATILAKKKHLGTERCYPVGLVHESEWSEENELPLPAALPALNYQLFGGPLTYFGDVSWSVKYLSKADLRSFRSCLRRAERDPREWKYRLGRMSTDETPATNKLRVEMPTEPPPTGVEGPADSVRRW